MFYLSLSLNVIFPPSFPPLPLLRFLYLNIQLLGIELGKAAVVKYSNEETSVTIGESVSSPLRIFL
jgi:hypothetical protein